MPRSYMERNIRNKLIVQDTHLRFSGNSTNSERSETSNRTIKSGSSYVDVQHWQNRDGQGRLQDIEEFNEFPKDYDDDIEENELHYNGRQREHYDNSRPPPLPSARPTYCVLEPGLVHRDTERDQSEPKHKSCSIKRACQCAIWTAIFLGISIGVALSTFNNMNANNLEEKIIEGYQDSGSRSDSGGQCYNSTTKGCVDQCDSMCEGDYQSCSTCNGYVTCAHRILHQRDCSSGSDLHLVWDDNTKTCESNTQGTITGVSQNSNECDNAGNSDRVQKSHSSTFLPQPVTPLVSLSQIQKNILSHSDIEKRRLQYDNAWNILEKGDPRLSNHYGPSVTTKQLGVCKKHHEMSRVSRNRESGLGYETDSGVHCYNSTTNGCVDQCYNICDGGFQSCWTCEGYITCANRILRIAKKLYKQFSRLGYHKKEV
uniref:Uncharacterized protein n=1 Tax=Magallana gigas TaxID=29159 RepID=A0A8W8NLC2_MAGGI